MYQYCRLARYIGDEDFRPCMDCNFPLRLLANGSCGCGLHSGGSEGCLCVGTTDGDAVGGV
jgi:hypothetical protein